MAKWNYGWGEVINISRLSCLKTVLSELHGVLCEIWRFQWLFVSVCVGWLCHTGQSWSKNGQSYWQSSVWPEAVQRQPQSLLQALKFGLECCNCDFFANAKEALFSQNNFPQDPLCSHFMFLNTFISNTRLFRFSSLFSPLKSFFLLLLFIIFLFMFFNLFSFFLLGTFILNLPLALM